MQGNFIPPQAQDVLLTERERIKRLADLYKAAALFNFKGAEVCLTILEGGERKQMNIAVMAAGSQSVMCSGGKSIPVQRILEVAFN